MSKQTECVHMNFSADCQVARLSKEDGGPITGYTLDVRVKCAECGLPFRFMGLPFGSHYAEPRLSADSEELRAPIEPAYTKEVLGMPIKAGNA